MSARPRREVVIEGHTWVLLDAWRSAGGLGLGYFARRGPEGWTSEDTDRRVALPTGRSLEDLEEHEVVELWDSGAPLTATERRFQTAGGDLWLAQGSGPVWNADGGAANAIGLRLACLTHDVPPVELPGRRLSELGDDELATLAVQLAP